MAKYPIARDASEVLGLDDMGVKDVDVDEWQLTIQMRPLTQLETEGIFKKATLADPDTGRPDTDLTRANRLALATCIVAPPFTIEQIDDLCNQHNGGVVSQLIQAHVELNHWDRLLGMKNGNKIGEGNADAAFPVGADQKTGV